MGNPIYILAGQSNASAMRQEFETALGTALGNTHYYAQTIASGGAPLTWQRSKDDWFSDTELRNALYSTIADTLQSDPDAYLAGIIWVQGEADTYTIARASNYAHELQNLIQGLRNGLEQNFNTRDMPLNGFNVIISGLSQNAPEADARENWETVRAQQALLTQVSTDIQLIDPDIVAQENDFQIDDLFKDGLHYRSSFQSSLMNALVANLLHLETVSQAVPKPKNVILGSADGEKLYGSNNDDIIFGGAGWDRYEGGAGNDTFVFSDEDNRWGERVVDFQDTKDNILINLQTDISFDDLNIFAHHTRDGTVVNYGAGSFILLGIEPSLITVSDFEFI